MMWDFIDFTFLRSVIELGTSRRPLHKSDVKLKPVATYSLKLVTVDLNGGIN